MNEFDRTKKMIGDKNFNLITKTSVVIVGLGGVGSSATEMLARSGINSFVVVDFDVFEESNLNRQILCLSNNIGKLKVEEAKKRIKLINKNAKVTCINVKLNDNIDIMLPKTDYIIDACDDIKAKVNLVKFAILNNIKIISCCGTGNRLHPEMLSISNIWKTNYDPLAKRLRHELRKEKINYKLPVVCSKEKPFIKTNGSVGSVCFVPNFAGILLASYVINDIIK